MNSMRSKLHPIIIPLACAVAAVASAGELYRTEFEEFAAGDDQWAGAHGWIGNSLGTGSHGIDQDAIPGGGLGRTAFIGYGQPASTFVFVARPLAYDPGPADLPVLEVQTIVGIQDSTASHPARDCFFVSIWNGAGYFLAGLRLANHAPIYGIWRLDGSDAEEQDTGGFFIRGELHLLTMRIDLPNNRWSADLDGIPLFRDATFHGGSEAVDCGYLSYEWQLTAKELVNYGNNWMMVADMIVRSCGRGIVPFRLSRFACDEGGVNLEWPGEIGFDYHVDYSADGVNWLDDLPGASFPGVLSDQVITFCDPASAVGRRLYRVRRCESP